MQTGNYHLVMEPAAPVRLFPPAFVSRLRVEQLQGMVGEDVSTKRKRRDLDGEIENLEQERKILV